MNTKKKTIKSILGCTTACSALMLSGVGVMNLNNQNYSTYAANVSSIPVTITNPNFNSETKSSYPYTPNSYVAYNNGVQVSSSNNIESNVKAGVINLSNEKYETKFSLAKRTSLDDYVLMVDSTDDNGAAHTVDYGFQTKNSFTLDANSKYMFTVDVFTVTNAQIANLYLFDSNGEVFSSINNINSHNGWTTYTFFVATNSLKSVELKLGMYMQGAGTVLFDNISGFKLSDNEYDISKDTAINGTFVEEDGIDNIESRFAISNDGKLVNVDDNSIFTNFTNTNFEMGKVSTLSTVADSDGQNSHALLVKNTDETYTQYETDSILNFEQNKVYKVSINVKTKDLNGTATLQLIRTDIAEDDAKYDAEKHNKTISITSSSVSANESVTNDYKTYSFFINSHPSKAVSYKLAFGLGTTDSLTTGEMYLSEVEVSKIDYSTFESATTGSGNEKINFVDAYSGSSIMLDNGDFNAFKIADYNSPMPATPVSWDVVTGKNTQKYGVVNTSTFVNDLKDYNLSNLRNPYSTDVNENVLMMYNETADTLSYKSTTKNLSAKSYHKFEVSVQTQNAPLKISLVTTKDGSEVELCAKTINTNNAWENVTLYLYTGYQSMDVSLKLTLDTTDYGYAYIDDTKFDYLLTASQLEQEFKNASNSASTLVADMSNFVESGSNAKFATSQLFSSEKVSGVESGTITLNSTYLDEVIDNTDYLESFNSLAENGTDKKVLGIWTTEDVNYKMTSKVGFKLTSGSDKYYKINVSVYTQNLSANNNETDLTKIGAGIKLSGFDNTFTSIKSNNEWTTYTFYIQPESDTTTYLELSLGNEEAKTKGAAFFGNIEFVENVTADEYNAITESATVKVVKPEAKAEEDNTTTEEEKTENKISNTTWIYLIPSLLTALAILIAVVGFAVRKIKWRKPKKKSKTSYDRNKTVSVQYYTRKATTLREEKIRELTNDYLKINEERKKYEDQYKQDLTKLRELKIKRANPTDITKLEKEMKKNQKMSSSLGVTANRIADELSYTKTDAYLNALVKKLSREQQSTKTENEEEEEK